MSKTIGLVLIAGIALWWLSKQSAAAQQQQSASALGLGIEDVASGLNSAFFAGGGM